MTKYVSCQYFWLYCILFPVTTCPKADNDLLMAAASTSLSPVASLLDILSDPARSTSVRLPLVVVLDTELYETRDNMRRR